MAPANVANVALLRQSSQHVEVMNVTGLLQTSFVGFPGLFFSFGEKAVVCFFLDTPLKTNISPEN